MATAKSKEDKKKIIKDRLHPVVRQYKELREMKGRTVDEISDLTGIGADLIRSYETGRVLPPLDKITKLVIAVGGNGIGVTGWR